MKRWERILLVNLASFFAMAVLAWVLGVLFSSEMPGEHFGVGLSLMERVVGITPIALRGVLLLSSWVLAPERAVPVLLGLLIIMFWFCRWREAIGFLCASIPPVIIVPVAKMVFQVPRPDVPWALIHEPGFSYPSGHATFSLVFYGMFSYLLGRPSLEPAVRMLVKGIASMVTISTGYSRIYLGVHYPSDVIAGYAIGVVALVAGVWTTEALKTKSQSSQF